MVTNGDVRPQIRLLVDGGVDETQDLLASSETLVVDAVEQRSNDGARHGGTTTAALDTAVDCHAKVTNGRDIGVSATSVVVNTASLGNDVVAGAVALDVLVMVGEEFVDRGFLVVGGSPQVTEASAGSELVEGRFLVRTPVHLGGADGGDIGAGTGGDGVEDVARQLVRVGTEVVLAGWGEFVSMVGGLPQALELGNSGLELNPSFVFGNRDTRDASVLEPLLDGLQIALFGSEELSNLFLRVVLAVLGRVRVRAVGSQYNLNFGHSG